MAKYSVYDELDILESDTEETYIEEQLSKIRSEVNEIDNEVTGIKDEIEEFMEQWRMKSFGEVEEFLQDTLNEIYKKLGKISERLY